MPIVVHEKVVLPLKIHRYPTFSFCHVKGYGNADKTKYMIMSQDQNAGRTLSMKIDNSSFGRVDEFKYLGTTLTNQNSIQKKLRVD